MLRVRRFGGAFEGLGDWVDVDDNVAAEIVGGVVTGVVGEVVIPVVTGIVDGGVASVSDVAAMASELSLSLLLLNTASFASAHVGILYIRLGGVGGGGDHVAGETARGVSLFFMSSPGVVDGGVAVTSKLSSSLLLLNTASFASVHVGSVHIRLSVEIVVVEALTVLRLS